MKKETGNKFNVFGLAGLFTYISFISWRLFFYAYSQNYRQQMVDISFNLVPFKTIMNYLSNSSKVSLDVWIYNLAGNIAAFMPLGLLLPMAFRGFRLGTTILVSFTLIFSAETAQLISRRGVFDVDDILLNMLGSIMGYAVFKMMNLTIKVRR